MSMKQELETWVGALQHYDHNEFEESIRSFQPIADTSKILFNCGVIRATLGEHEAAVQYYQKATALDQYLAIAYFQQGVSNFLLGDFEEALANFNDALLYLRGNNNIDYDQLGLKFKLFSCEVLFNRGLCYIYLQATETGLNDLRFAAKEKVLTPEHDVIDEAITEKAEGYTVFSIPVGVVFRPSEAKVKNVRARDYLGKARLVASNIDQPPAHRRNVSMDQWSRDDRPAEKISFAATNLVRPGLASRSRQQSEPPLHRNMFPPTPPPEADKPANMKTDQRFSADNAPTRHGRSQSQQRAPATNPPTNHIRARSGSRSRPENLDLGLAAFERPLPNSEHPRRGTARSSSERPAPRRAETDPRYGPCRERLFGAVDNDEQRDDNDASRYRSDQPRRSPREPHSAKLNKNRPHFISEEPEDLNEVTDDGPPARTMGSQLTDNRRPSTSRVNSDRITSVKSIRVKVHFADDTRYMIVASVVSYVEFIEQVMKKFNVMKGGIKVRTKDEEGDLITIGDQDDFDMTTAVSRDVARREASDLAKMEVWIQEIP